MCSPGRAGTCAHGCVDAHAGIVAADGHLSSGGLVYGPALEPLALLHQGAGVRQATHIPHLHLQVVSCFQDVNGLIVGDDNKALAIHLQDLLAHL